MKSNISRSAITLFVYLLSPMSIRLCVRNLQERRFRAREQARNLIHTCEPPRFPAIQGLCCNAIEMDGRHCHLLLLSDDQFLCDWHLRELNALHGQWEKLQCDADSIRVVDADTAKQKVHKLRSTLELRRQIRERFHTRGVDTMDFVGWLVKLEEDIRAIANTVLGSLLRIYLSATCILTCRSIKFYP